MLQIYNSLTRRKEPFETVDGSNRVRFYYCGPTVYDSMHVGHARAAVVPDMVRRYLEWLGYDVRYVTNFTDVDDKIIQRSIERNMPWRDLVRIYIEEYHELTTALGNRPADAHPRCTDHLDDMITLIRELIEGGNAYVAKDGDVYFDTASHDGYGSLSGRSLEDQQADASGRVGEGRLAVKKNPADFILWKLHANDPDELKRHSEAVPTWESPWGAGRPGWHTECSAMSYRYLGMPFDIHGGGMDLLFPHHENEKAQNECAFSGTLSGRESARFWIHNGFINAADDEKMSKSLGNVRWLREVITPEGPYDPMVIRMWLLSSHYRSPMSFSAESLDHARAGLDRLWCLLEELNEAVAGADAGDADAALEQSARAAADGADEAFRKAMNDDFNSPAALAALFELASVARKEGLVANGSSASILNSAIRSLLGALGLRCERCAAGAGDSEEALLDLLLEARQEARANKLYALADRIRDRLADAGFEIQDTGTESRAIKR